MKNLTEEERQAQHDEAYGEGIRLAFEGSKRTGWMHLYDNPPQWVVDGFNAGWEAQKQAEAIGENLY